MAKHLVKKSNAEVIICGKADDVITVVNHIKHFPTIKVVVSMESQAATAKQISSKATLYSFQSWLRIGMNVSKSTLTTYMNKHLSPNKARKPNLLYA